MSYQQPDELTGAFSRADFSRYLELLHLQYVENGREYAVAMLDVDHLKTVNDVYGHAAGDAVIRTVAQRAMHVLRGGDRLFRYGGDEFVILLPRTTLSEAAGVLKRVRDNIVSDPVDAGQSLTVTISIGLAASSESSDTDSAGALLKADERLLLAKRRGRNSLATEDRPAAPSDGMSFASTRLYGRDVELASVDEFLNSSHDSGRERTMQVSGPAGVGHSRFLSEVGVRAGLMGRAVRHLQAESVHGGLHLRALELAYRDEISADASAEAVATRLSNDAESSGLVLLLEGGNQLDQTSRQLISERLHRHGTLLIEAVQGGHSATFPAGRTVQLAPLKRDVALQWLSAATAGPLEALTGSALLLAGRGLPGKLERLVRGLQESGDLKMSPSGLAGRPEVIAAAAERLDREPDLRPPNLPAWDTPLVGRNQLLELIRPTAQASRMLVLTGPGGIGKSRLAAQLALELAGDAAGGTDWIDLRAVSDAASLPRLISVTLGFEPASELSQLVSQLAEQRRLLVFDEADGVAGSAGVFSELLNALPGLKVIITARMPLRLPGETVVEVPELVNSAGAELFQQGMVRQGSTFDVRPAELSRLLEATGYAPLSIELAAAWTGVFSPAELAERLARQPELLVDAPGLQPGTARFIDVTRQLMSEAEQESLGTLALNPAGFTAEMALELASASPFFLLALLERALLRREGSRYTVHAAIAERYRAGLQGPHAARQRMAAAWSRFAARIEGLGLKEKSLQGYRQVDVEEANLNAAWLHLLEPPQPGLLWPLVRVLRGYMDVRGRRRDALALFTHADAMLADCADLELRGWVRECVALFQAKLERLEEAASTIAGAHELLELHGPPGLTQAMAWNTTGMIHGFSGQDEAALQAFYRSAEIRAGLGDVVGEAQARGNAVMALGWLDRQDEALALLRAAVQRYREVGHLSGLSISLAREAGIMRTSGLGTALMREQVAREGAELAAQLGYAAGGLNGYEELGEALADLDRLGEAAAAMEQAAYWAELEGDATRQAGLLRRAAELSGQELPAGEAAS